MVKYFLKGDRVVIVNPAYSRHVAGMRAEVKEIIWAGTDGSMCLSLEVDEDVDVSLWNYYPSELTKEEQQ